MALFEKFKARNEGRGPAQVLFDRATDGQGILGRRGVKQERALTDQLIAEVRGVGGFEGLDPFLKLGESRMTREEHTAYRSALLERASRVQLGVEAAGVLGEQLDMLSESAADPLNARQVEAFRMRADIASKYARSADPTVQAYGLQALQALGNDISAFTATNEVQAIENQTLRESRTEAAANLRFERDMAMSTDLRATVVNPYQEAMQQFGKAKALLNTGDRLGYDMAFTMAIMALDGSVVRAEERMSYTGSNGLVAQAVDLYNRWKGEKSEDVEKALRRSINALQNSVTESYRNTVDTYRRQAEAYGGDWRRISSVVPEMKDWTDGGSPSPSADRDDVPEPPAESSILEDVADVAGTAAAGASLLYDAVPPELKGAAAVGLTPLALAAAKTALPYVPVAAPMAASVVLGAGMVSSKPFPDEPPRSRNIKRGVYLPRFIQPFFAGDKPLDTDEF